MTAPLSITDSDAAACLQRSAVQAIVEGRFPAWLEACRANLASSEDSVSLADVLAEIHDPTRTIELAERLAAAPPIH
jgi:hypothetical protein